MLFFAVLLPNFMNMSAIALCNVRHYKHFVVQQQISLDNKSFRHYNYRQIIESNRFSNYISRKRGFENE